jgi:hypothetical protein
VPTVKPTASFVTKAAPDGTNGTGGSVVAPAGSAIDCTDVTDGLVKAIDGGAGTSGENWYAVYEVFQNDPNTPETLYFGVQLSYDASTGGLPAPTTASGTVTGNYAPLNLAANSTVIPRFRTVNQSAGVTLTINACTTTLLFPYVTADLDTKWDTGLAFANTSKDDGQDANRSSSGACTLNFFGANAPAKVTFPATGTIDPGTTQAAMLSALAPGFTGYIIARCNFQYGHALALLIEPGAANMAFGSSTSYLALVIPDTGDPAVRPALPFVVGGGEQLGF